jgi:hypothetical protein
MGDHIIPRPSSFELVCGLHSNELNADIKAIRTHLDDRILFPIAKNTDIRVCGCDWNIRPKFINFGYQLIVRFSPLGFVTRKMFCYMFICA